MKKELNVITMVGIPGSGKTTWTKNKLKECPDYISVNRDAYRFMLRDEPFTAPHIERLITDLQDQTILKCLDKNLNVIVDATHLKKSYINALCKLVKYKADVSFKLLDVPIDTCIERDNNREKKVGEEVIRRMYENYLNLKNNFDFKPILKSTPPLSWKISKFLKKLAS